MPFTSNWHELSRCRRQINWLYWHDATWSVKKLPFATQHMMQRAGKIHNIKWHWVRIWLCSHVFYACTQIESGIKAHCTNNGMLFTPNLHECNECWCLAQTWCRSNNQVNKINNNYVSDNQPWLSQFEFCLQLSQNTQMQRSISFVRVRSRHNLSLALSQHV